MVQISWEGKNAKKCFVNVCISYFENTVTLLVILPVSNVTLPIKFIFFYQCCGSGSGIRCLFDPWSRDPGWVKIQDRGSGLNNPDHISKSLGTIFSLKYLDSFMADPDPGSGVFLTLDPGSGMAKFGSGINIPDPQHCFFTFLFLLGLRFRKPFCFLIQQFTLSYTSHFKVYLKYIPLSFCSFLCFPI